MYAVLSRHPRRVFIASQRMEAALLSAEAHLLHERREQVFSGNDGHIAATAAQAPTSAVLADGATHGGHNAGHTLKRSAVDISTKLPSPSNNDCATANLAGDSATDLPPSGGSFVAKCLDKAGGSPERKRILLADVDVCKTASNSSEYVNQTILTPEDVLGIALDGGATANIIARTRLLYRRVAEERIAAMADHLGWAEPIRLHSFASPPTTSMSPSSSRAHCVTENQPHPISTEDHITEEGSLSTRQETTTSKLRRRRQYVGTTPARRGDPETREKLPHSAKIASTTLRSDSFQVNLNVRDFPCGALDVPPVEVVEGVDSSNRSGSKKRRRRRRSESSGGNQEERSLSVGRAALSRSSSFAMGQRRSTLERDGRSHIVLELHAVGSTAVPSLPRIHASRLHR